MASTRPTRAGTNARTQLLSDLKDDHKRVKQAYRAFQKLDDQNTEACAVIVTQVLNELTVHATLEEELLYPAARGAKGLDSLVDEAEVEHESVHALIDQLRGMAPGDAKYAARFTVLCEYVTHHVKEEEGEMFPQLEKARLDWVQLAEEMNGRRAELTAAQDGETAAAALESNPVRATTAAAPKAKSRAVMSRSKPGRSSGNSTGTSTSTSEFLTPPRG